ncbi:MAG: hypothetical protein JF623_05170, partial [Acidobacteria bacterium]|nr:hypothetical protein [Acidobacteriota bacterium]
MNAHALAGLAALNLWLYITGVAVLFAIRGWNRWSGLARLSGLAYLLGVATSGVVWIFELVVGIPFGIVAIVVTGLVIGAVGVAVGLRLGRRLPPRPSRPTRLPAVSPVVAVSVALVVVYLEALFRVARLDGLYEFDAWDFWIPKAKAIYYFGGLDPQFFREVINQSYPPLVPTLEAAAFHFMGAADVVTLHVQFWLLFVGFVAAIAGLLSPRVSPFFLWPPLLLLVVAPYVIGHATQTTADFALDELIAASVLLVALWLIDRAQWQLSAAT